MIDLHCFKRPKTVLLLILTGCFLVILYQYHSSSTSSTSDGIDFHDRSPRRAGKVVSLDSRTNYQLVGENDSEKSEQVTELIERIEDLRRIKASVIGELQNIQKEKAKLLKDKTLLITRNDRLTQQINRSKSHLKQLELDISSNRRRKFELNCDIDRWAPVVFNPLKSEEIKSSPLSPLPHVISYSNVISFDFSSCSLTKEFKFHVLKLKNQNIVDNRKLRVEPDLVYEILSSHEQHTEDHSNACLLVSLIDNSNEIPVTQEKNHLVIDLIGGLETSKLPKNVPLASFTYRNNSFRNQLDLMLPSIWQMPLNYESIVGSIPPQSPINRKFLASYFGSGHEVLNQSLELPAGKYLLDPLEEVLQIVHRNSIDDLFLFIYDCGSETNPHCYEEKEKMIELSTFCIILPPKSADMDDHTNDLIYLSLSRGTIPVIVGRGKVRLPFDEVIDWRRAALIIPTGRLPEIHFILKTINPADIYQLKYQGRRIFEQYLATAKQILDSTIAVISLERFNFPPPPIKSFTTTTHKNQLIIDSNCSTSYCLESRSDTVNSLLSSETYGPRDIPFASPSFRRNLSLAFSFTYELWNNPLYSAFHLYPNSPADPIPPSEYKFFSSDNGYRPIADGLGGSGEEFSRSIGGDYPNEQFTIVLLTYERESIMMKTLERLKGLAYLNKVLVIWNSVNQEPSEDIVWPDIGVPIKLIKVNKNSLNNRFLPYDAIETDAILSLDDDSPLRPDEIVFAFRVWRQSRDRIVGFPGRYHAWDRTQNSWLYNSNHSCELSMVLTGGAFFHKFYTYIYTYSMPEVVRAIVDKFMNCEDIAMNFLVAHLTRKPPIKVTSRWTFHCPNCPSSLSEDDSHFKERHECLNTFTSIYGYMPLLSTQHRSDSVLFKTRLPHDKQKCYRFI